MRTKLAEIITIGSLLLFAALGVFMAMGKSVQARVGSATQKMVGTISHPAAPLVAYTPSVVKRPIIPKSGGFYVKAPKKLCYITIQDFQTLGERWFIVSHPDESVVLDFNRNGFIPAGKVANLSELSFRVIEKDALKSGEDYHQIAEGDPRLLIADFSFGPEDDFKSVTLLLKSVDKQKLVLELKDSEARQPSAKP